MHQIARTILAALLVGGTAEASSQPNDQIADLKRLSLEQLMEMDITSASRRAERVTNAPTAISVITAEDIRRSGASTLPDVLRLATGLHVARFNGASWAVSSRGFASTANNKLLVLIDGRSVYTQLFGGVFWETQDYVLPDIERIEVIRGPAGTLWGPNAVNGVINIITKTAAATRGTLVVAEAGSRQPGRATIRHGGTMAGSNAYRVYGKTSHFGSPQLASGISAGEDRRIHQAGFRVDLGSPASPGVTLQGDLTAGSFSLADRPNADHWNGNLLARMSRRLSPESQLEVLAYIDAGHREVPRQSSESRTIYDVEAQHDVQVTPRHRVLWGGGFRSTHDRTETGGVLFFEPADRNIHQGELFAQDEITLVPDKWFLTVGSRVERTTFTGFEFQPSVRARIHPSPRMTIWGAASRAVRTPTRFDQDLRVQIGTFVAIRGDRAFRSETLNAYESGVRLGVNRTLSLDASAFVHDYAHLRSQEPTTAAPFPVTLANLYEGRTSGIELSGNYEPVAWWLLNASYVFQRVELKPSTGGRDATDARAEAEDPDHLLGLRSYLDLPGGVEIDLMYRGVGELRGGRTPSYHELDVRLGWQATPQLDLSLIGRDLLHRRHAELSGGGSQLRYFQREVLGRLGWTF